MSKRPASKKPASEREKALKTANRKLEEELRQARTLRNPDGILDPVNANLLRNLTLLLLDLEEAANPLRGQLIEAQTRIKHPDSTSDEGSQTRWARKLNADLTRNINNTINNTARQLKGEWAPTPPVPKVRCRLRHCPALDITVPAWRDLRDGTRLYNERCSACGSPYAADTHPNRNE